MSVIELIKERKSVRSFTGQVLSEKLVNEINNFIKNLIPPFGVKARIQLVRSGKAEIVELKRNGYIAEAGKTVKQIAFILEGIVGICCCYNKGDEITRYFFDKKHLLYSPEFMTGMPMPEYWQSVTDCRLVVFSIRKWKELSDTIIGWDEIIQKIATKNHKGKLDRRSSLVAQDATARYLEFLAQFPSLANQIPLLYIASYLGITQSSLSRIRKNIR